jgi:hypothetical protein
MVREGPFSTDFVSPSDDIGGVGAIDTVTAVDMLSPEFEGVSEVVRCFEALTTAALA